MLAHEVRIPYDCTISERSMSSFLRLSVVTLAVAWLATACTTQSWDPRRWFSRDETPKPAVREVPGVEARLRGIGSAASGMVRVRESGELLIVYVELGGVKPGTYRVVFHETGNCSSPSCFSAGAPWSAPGARVSATQLVPVLNANTEGRGELVARLRGVRMGEGGMVNRGVLVYEGMTAVPPKPDEPNNVVACGAFVKSTFLF
jgi:Cu/Zn superoxide dismutase